jgi:hypothetical protein
MEVRIVPLIPRAPHPGDLMKVIRRLANAGAVGFSYHAFAERSEERGIDMPDALTVLREGMIRDPIVAGRSPGEWKCKVVDKLEGSSRWIGVATVVIRNERLFILTVEWEDK